MSSEINNANRTFAIAIVGTAVLGVLALGAAAVLNVSLAGQFHWSLRDGLIGIAATAPMIGFLYWFMTTDNGAIADFRESQIEFFAEIGFKFTWPRIFAMALFAGVFEELLFRGALQTGLANWLGVVWAIILTNLLFGVLHWRTALYALIAGLVGVWLSLVFTLTGNLLAPIIAHGLYDLVALGVTAQAIAKWRADKQQEGSTDAI